MCYLRIGIFYETSYAGGCIPFQISEFEQRCIATSAENFLYLGPKSTNRPIDLLVIFGKQVFFIEVLYLVLDGCASEFRISERYMGSKRDFVIFFLGFI